MAEDAEQYLNDYFGVFECDGRIAVYGDICAFRRNYGVTNREILDWAYRKLRG